MDCKANCDREVFYEVQLLQKCFVSIINYHAKSGQQKLTIPRFDINLGTVVLWRSPFATDIVSIYLSLSTLVKWCREKLTDRKNCVSANFFNVLKD